MTVMTVMTVQMKRLISGTRDGVDWPPPGSFITLDQTEARPLIELDLAIDIADVPPAIEPKITEAIEHAVQVATGRFNARRTKR